MSVGSDSVRIQDFARSTASEYLLCCRHFLVCSNKERERDGNHGGKLQEATSHTIFGLGGHSFMLDMELRRVFRPERLGGLDVFLRGQL